MITPGELSPGMKVTVLAWKPREIREFSMFGEPTVTRTHVDKSYCGEVLTVTCVLLPYVIVERFSHFPSPFDAIRLDTRELDLLELTPEYVAATTKGVAK